MRSTRRIGLVLAATGVIATLGACGLWAALRADVPGSAGAALAAAPTAGRSAAFIGEPSETPHYRILSAATPAQTGRVADAVESLYRAYAAFFPDLPQSGRQRAKLQLVLYRDQRQFKAHNRSRPWAEAYYRPPICYAYYAEGQANPYHWMVHEATHQLNHEVARFADAKWIDEGLASYFATSRIQHGSLLPGVVDRDTYPIWWLPNLALSGNLREDLDRGRLIPLRALIADTGPDIATRVNLYYIEYWSLSHFLFHYRDGRYADGYRRLIASGGSLKDFERHIGPVERIEAEWYGYLRRQRADLFSLASAGSDDSRIGYRTIALPQE